MLKYFKKHFKIIESWGLDKNPFRAIDDYDELKAEKRHLISGQKKAYNKYWQRRFNWTMGKNFKSYYKTKSKPIDKWTWEYLRQRKRYFQMPLGWNEILRHGGSIIDVGCGDGDLIQNFIDFANKNKQTLKKNKIKILGVDVNGSRIKNAKKFVKSDLSNIKVEFKKANFINFLKLKFDYAFVAGVFEILDDKDFITLVKKLDKTILKTIYIEDLMEQFPGGYPRYQLSKYFKNFEIKSKHTIFTEPFNLKKLTDPKKIWPIHIDQNLLLVKK
jgi:SAM-dependent methyltransferase